MPARFRPHLDHGHKKSVFRKVFLFLLVVVVLGLVVFLILQRRVWNERLPLSLVIVTPQKVSIMQLDPTKRRAVWLELPGNLEVRVAGQGSRYQIKSLWRFGEVEGKAGLVVTDTLAAATGIWIDGYIYTPNESKDLGFDLVWNKTARSNIHFIDRYRVVSFFKSLRSDQIDRLMVSENITEKQLTPDNYEILSINEQRFSSIISDKFVAPTVLADRRTVSIANGSGTPGLSKLMEKMIVTIGGSVIEVKEGEKIEDLCKVIYSGNTDGLVTWLKDRVGCKLTRDERLNAKSEIEITVGEAFGRRFKTN